MKPAKFDYHDPTSIDEALGLMSQFGDQARPLAGGQSLVPLMNFRLIRPAHLIDLNGVDELSYLSAEDAVLRIGATTRQRQLERSAEIARRWPLLRDAAAFIGHIQIRNRGTVGGSLAHAFPSAELPVAMVTLGASMLLRAKTTRRSVRAEDFFLSTMTTALQPEELLTEISVPELPANTGWSYQEVSRRYGDFALAGSASLLAVDGKGDIRYARLALTGVTPIRARKAEESLVGERPSEALFCDAAQRATENLEQDSDIHASAEYRRAACAALARRALTQAAQRASDSMKGTLR
ncbi:MAG TPA: xanthine dehydrogenase family protein subunit M [Verrucomicrobiae bacterium]|nr:xanthine dehydrogenase family protein subunit M [Verrucomicrobiae bacterium]